jgi:hypothetical protein
VSEMWPRTKSNCADEGQQQFTQKQVSHDSEVTVGSAHRSRGISTVRSPSLPAYQIPSVIVVFVVLVCKV